MLHSLSLFNSLPTLSLLSLLYFHVYLNLMKLVAYKVRRKRRKKLELKKF